jgi:hypothetical protein
MTEPLAPRITKSTAVAAIKARFPSVEDLLKRFEVAKAQANLWDGERDGIREVVKTLEPGMYGDVVLAKSESAPVLYPNSSGKHQLENCIQCTVESTTRRGGVAVLHTNMSADAFLDHVLSLASRGKEQAQQYIRDTWLGSGEIVDNDELYEKKGSEKSTITIL